MPLLSAGAPLVRLRAYDESPTASLIIVVLVAAGRMVAVCQREDALLSSEASMGSEDQTSAPSCTTIE